MVHRTWQVEDFKRVSMTEHRTKTEIDWQEAVVRAVLDALNTVSFQTFFI